MRTGPGFFLTIEGVEGAGKSSLARLIADELAGGGAEVVVTEEPGGSDLGSRIREMLLDSAEAVSDRAELFLFEAARAHHVDTKIMPALNRGAVVICDRFADSSIAYQGYARGLDLEMVSRLNEYATRGLKPDLTLLLDLPADVGLARQRRSDRISSQSLAFHEAVRNGYLRIAEAEPDRLVVIDGARGLEDVLRASLAAIEAHRH